MADLNFPQSADPVCIFNDSSQNQLAVNSDGSVNTVSLNSSKSTYAGATLNIASAATATDIFTIFGSGTKTIKILVIGVSGVQTTASDVIIRLIFRSSANSGGTSASVTKVPYDSTNSAATATVLSYTANPTLGTAVGDVVTDRLFVPPAGANTMAETLVFRFGESFGQPIILRGTAQGLCMNLNSTTILGGSFNFWVEWTEE